MVDQFVETTQVGFLSKLGRSFVAIPIGILLFFGSFFVLYMNEGRTNWAEIAEESEMIPPGETGVASGTFVSITGTLDTDDEVGDPEFIAPGRWVTLERQVQVYAWVEHKRTETRKKLGGGEERVTTTTYEKEWVSQVPDSSGFDHPEGHANPPQQLQGRSFFANNARIGRWSFEPGNASLPGGSPLSLDQVELIGRGADAERVGNELYIGLGTPTQPQVGDMKVSFRALVPGGEMTIFGDTAANSRVVPHTEEDEGQFLRVFDSNRPGALETMRTEHKVIGWVLRLVGFLMMWIGMTMVFAPLTAVADIIPFIGSASRFIIGLVLFPIALVLTTVAVVISMIMHNIWAMLAVGIAFTAMVIVAIQRKSAKA